MVAAPRRALMALVLVVLTLVSGGCSRMAAPSTSSAGGVGLATTAPSGALQEVAPPGAVQQLNERLDERSPQITVVAPADQALLPAGPWTLQLRIDDWPISDAGELGLGPHLVVQLDDQEPLRVSSVEQAAAIPMPELRPGSHRVTVYAARPWGEAVKAPGASRQIKVHRVSRNTAELPANGTAQLIPSSPDALQQVEPVLIDWLLLDAPLQNLRGDDARWRLRISVNGDSFLVDRQTPIWLKGFKRGSNAVQLELLDGRGDPLNPPFNSVVREVVIGNGARPAWQRNALSAAELALLSGEQLPPVPTAIEPAAPESTAAEVVQPNEPAAMAPVATEPTVAAPEPEPEPTQTAAAPEATPQAIAEQGDPPTPEPEPRPEPEPEPQTTTTTTQETSASTAAVAPPPAEKHERLTPQTTLTGSARDQVNADGSLQHSPRRGPLAGLREKLGG